MPQLRQNIITGEWVVFAPERAKRPSDYISEVREKKQSTEDCPFCIRSKKSEYENRIKKFDTPSTYVLTNKYPAFIEDGNICTPKKTMIEGDFFAMKPALGGHDVVVVKNHDIDIYDFPNKTWDDLYATFQKRFKYFAKLCNVEYVMPIYNHGPQAAASIDHPHAQIFASAVVPNSVTRELTHTSNYYATRKHCAFCDLIEHEQDQNTRVVFENESFIAFSFYAAKNPFEIWILPKTHSSDFSTMTAPQRENLSKISRQVFSRLNNTLNDPPLNFYIHSEPVQTENELPYYHWHMEITPRLSLYGGYELGSGMVIDIITPEQAAEYLRLGRKGG